MTRPKSTREWVHDTPVHVEHPLDSKLRAYLESRHPPPALEDARQRVADRLETPTGQHDLAALQRELQAQAISGVREQLEAEREARRKAEAALEERGKDVRKFWLITLSGIVVGLTVAAIIWAVAVLVAASKGVH